MSCQKRAPAIEGPKVAPTLKLLVAGISLIIIGSALLLTAMLLPAIRTTEAAFVFFLGPIPILFGASISPLLIVLLSAVLAVMLIALVFALRRWGKSLI